jgi:hypothetical protein
MQIIHKSVAMAHKGVKIAGMKNHENFRKGRVSQGGVSGWGVCGA